MINIYYNILLVILLKNNELNFIAKQIYRPSKLQSQLLDRLFSLTEFLKLHNILQMLSVNALQQFNSILQRLHSILLLQFGGLL